MSREPSLLIRAAVARCSLSKFFIRISFPRKVHFEMYLSFIRLNPLFIKVSYSPKKAFRRLLKKMSGSVSFLNSILREVAGWSIWSRTSFFVFRFMPTPIIIPLSLFPLIDVSLSMPETFFVINFYIVRPFYFRNKAVLFNQFGNYYGHVLGKIWKRKRIVNIFRWFENY